MSNNVQNLKEDYHKLTGEFYKGYCPPDNDFDVEKYIDELEETVANLKKAN